MTSRGRLDHWPVPLRLLLRFLLGAARRALGLARRLGWRLSPARLRATWRWARLAARRIVARRRTAGLTVAVDINPLWEPLTGVGWYLYILLQRLADAEGIALRLYGPELIGDGEAPEPVVVIPRGAALEVVRYDVPSDLSLPPGTLARLLRLGERLLVAADGNRVVFAPNFFLPGRLRWARGTLVVTVHDLAFRRFSWTLREATRRDLLRNLERTLARAGRVITPSETVRRELVDAGLVPAERVRAILHGPGHLAAVGGGPLPASLPKEYVLHVGTLEPRKNLSILLAAWQQLAARQRVPTLVLCGGYGWKSGPLREEVEAAVRRGLVRHLGYVEDATLATLYRRALLVVSPSLYEGFGLPVIEALEAGRPVVCSDIPVFREVAADGARFVAAEAAEAWTEALAELLASPEGRAQLAERGQRRAASFDWDRSARQTTELWHEAASATVPPPS